MRRIVATKVASPFLDWIGVVSCYEMCSSSIIDRSFFTERLINSATIHYLEWGNRVGDK